MKNALIVGLASTAMLLLAGCEGNSKIRQLSDTELAAKATQCGDGKGLSPGMAAACGNIAKECKRRGEEMHNYVCTLNYD